MFCPGIGGRHPEELPGEAAFSVASKDYLSPKMGAEVFWGGHRAVACFESVLFSLLSMNCTFVWEQPLEHLLRDTGLGDGSLSFILG